MSGREDSVESSIMSLNLYTWNMCNLFIFCKLKNFENRKYLFYIASAVEAPLQN